MVEEEMKIFFWSIIMPVVLLGAMVNLLIEKIEDKDEIGRRY